MRHFNTRNFVVVLEGETDSDGGVLLRAKGYPMFSVVGMSEEEALTNALKLLPEYFADNYQMDVSVEMVPSSVDELGSDIQSIIHLPAHVIASLQEGPDCSASSGRNC